MELWDLYTRNREKTGLTMVRGEKMPEGDYYRIVVHICVFNSRGEMLIQQRQPFKAGWSGMWDVSVGGSAIAGDDSLSAAIRETGEELGLALAPEELIPALTLHFRHGFDDFYTVMKDVEISSLSFQPEEVRTARWAREEEILSMIDAGEFIPYDRHMIGLLFLLRGRQGAVRGRDTTVPAPREREKT